MRIVLLFTFTIFLAFPFATYGQSAPASVRPEQDSYVVRPGAMTTVVVRLENATDVYAVDVRASYDYPLIEVMDSDSGHVGIQVEPGQLPQPDLVLSQDVDPNTGTLRYIVSQLNPTLPANGGGVLFTVHLRGLGTVGSGEFRIENVEMSDRDGNLLPVEWAGAKLQVEGSTVTGHGEETTGIVVAPTNESSTGMTTSTSNSSATKTPLKTTQPTATQERFLTSTPLTATEIPLTIAETTFSATLSPITTDDVNLAEVAETEPEDYKGTEGAVPPSANAPAGSTREVIETVSEADKTTATRVAIVIETDLGSPHELADSTSTPAATARAVTNQTDEDSVDEAEATPEAELAVVGEGQTIRNPDRTNLAGSSPKAASSVVLVVLVIGLGVLVAVGAVLISRRPR